MPFRIKVSLIIIGGLLAMLLIVPLVIPIAPLEDTRSERELAYPDSRFVEVAGVALHVQTQPPARDPGEAPFDGDTDVAFVLLHGFGSQTMTWRRLAPALAEHAPTIAFDRPAFGLTERPMPGSWVAGANPYAPEAQLRYVRGLMDGYGVERAVLVGHSAGGALALEFALQYPERVAGVVVLGGAVVRGGGPPGWTRPLLGTPHMERLGPVFMRQLAGPSGEHFLRSAYADPGRLDPEDVEHYTHALSAHDWDRALWEHSKASRELALMPRLPELRLPVLVVTGTDDRIVPPELSDEVAAALPEATLARLPDCGHVVQEECPAALLEVLEPWLDEVLAPLGDRH